MIWYPPPLLVCSMSVVCQVCWLCELALPLYGLIAQVSTYLHYTYLHIYIYLHIYTCRLFTVSIRLDTFSIVRGHTLLYMHYTGLITRTCFIVGVALVPCSENMHLYIEMFRCVYKLVNIISNLHGWDGRLGFASEDSNVKSIASHCNEVRLLSTAQPPLICDTLMWSWPGGH